MELLSVIRRWALRDQLSIREIARRTGLFRNTIRNELGKDVRHRTSRYLNNRLEQDHRGIKGRYQPVRSFKCPHSAARFCRGYDELRNLLRPRSCSNQHVSADRRKLLFLRRTATVLGILQAA